jgi:hypothetical protein
VCCTGILTPTAGLRAKLRVATRVTARRLLPPDAPRAGRCARSAPGSGPTASACWWPALTRRAPSSSTAAPPAPTSTTRRWPSARARRRAASAAFLPGRHGRRAPCGAARRSAAGPPRAAERAARARRPPRRTWSASLRSLRARTWTRSSGTGCRRARARHPAARRPTAQGSHGARNWLACPHALHTSRAHTYVLGTGLRTVC